MIVASNSAAQVLAPGQAIVFDAVIFRTCNGCACAQRTNRIKITKPGTHKVTFSGNIGATTATSLAQLTIEADGSPLPETVMESMTEAAGDLNNVSNTTLLNVCCCENTHITVVNTGTTTVNVAANSSLIIE